jgi:hypothetical protein
VAQPFRPAGANRVDGISAAEVNSKSCSLTSLKKAFFTPKQKTSTTKALMADLCAGRAASHDDVTQAGFKQAAWDEAFVYGVLGVVPCLSRRPKRDAAGLLHDPALLLPLLQIFLALPRAQCHCFAVSFRSDMKMSMVPASGVDVGLCRQTCS